MSFSTAKQLTRDTLQAYSDDHAERLAAALAYYGTFSLAPLLVLTLAVAGRLFGQRSEAARVELIGEARDVLGAEGAALLTDLLEGAAASPSAGLWATMVSGVVLVLGATTLFARLQEALNTIWGASPQYTGLAGLVRSRALSLVLVVGGGAVLVASLVLSSLLTGLADAIAGQTLLRAAERLGSVAVLALVCGVLYRTLPDAPVRWADVWPGALLAAVLLTLGTWALGWYLGYATVASSYGAAGALVALLLWIYYSAQIFFLGAEFTTVYARREASPAGAAPASPGPASTVPASPAPPSPPSSWGRRLGWVALGLLLALFFRR